MREDLRNKLEVRRQKDNLVICAYLPPRLVKEFEETILRPRAIRQEHWETAKKAIRAVQIAPKDWSFEPWQFYAMYRICNLRLGRNFSLKPRDFFF